MIPTIQGRPNPAHNTVVLDREAEEKEAFEALDRRDWGFLDKRWIETSDIRTIASCCYWGGRFLFDEGNWKEAHTAFQAAVTFWLGYLNMRQIPANPKSTGSLREAIQCFGVQQSFIGLDQWLDTTAVEAIVGAAMNCGRDEAFQLGASLLWLAQSKAEMGNGSGLWQTEKMCEEVFKAWLVKHEDPDNSVTTCLGRLYLMQGLKTHQGFYPQDTQGAWGKVQLALSQPVEEGFAIERAYAVYKVYRQAGDFRNALPLIESVVQITGNAYEDSSFAKAMYRVELAKCLMSLPEVDLERVDQEVSYGIKYAEAHPDSGCRMITAYCIKTRVLLARGELAEAKHVLGIAQYSLQRLPDRSKAVVSNVQIAGAEVAYADYEVAYSQANFGAASQAIEFVVHNQTWMTNRPPLAQVIHCAQFAECLLHLPEQDLDRVDQQLQPALQYVTEKPFSDPRLIMPLYLKALVQLKRNNVAEAKGYLEIAQKYLQTFSESPKEYFENVRKLESDVCYEEYREAHKNSDFATALQAIEQVLPYVDGSDRVQADDRLSQHLRVADLLLDLKSDDWERFDREIALVYDGIERHDLKSAVVGVAHLIRGFGQLRRGNIDEAKHWYMNAKEYEMPHEREFAPYEASMKQLEDELAQVERKQSRADETSSWSNEVM